MRYFATCIIKDRLPQLHSVDDIVQDAFVALWERRQAFASERSVKTFLYTAVRNSCLNLLRHQDVRQRYTNSAARGGVQESFLDELLEAEIFGELLETFNALPPACREVYRLSLEGKPHEEIAELLNISINTIKKHKNNANHFMRKRLKHLLVVEYLLAIDRLTDLLN